MNKILFSLCLLSGFFTSSSLWATPWQKEGERLTYDVRWSFIPVGQAELLFMPSPQHYSLIGRAWTDDESNTLYRIRDRIQIQGSNQEFYTQKYHVELQENKYRANKTVVYDRTQNTTAYTNVHAGHEPRIFDVEPNARDLISALYYLRKTQKNIQVGDVYTLPVFDLDKAYTLTLEVQQKVRKKTVLGNIQTFKIKPVLTREENDKTKSKERLTLWVSADENLVPVEMEIELVLGKFRAILKKIGNANSASSAPKELPQNGAVLTKK